MNGNVVLADQLSLIDRFANNFFLKMSKLIQILHSPFWGAAIVTIILLTTGDLKWWLFGLFFYLPFLEKFISNIMNKTL